MNVLFLRSVSRGHLWLGIGHDDSVQPLNLFLNHAEKRFRVGDNLPVVIRKCEDWRWMMESVQNDRKKLAGLLRGGKKGPPQTDRGGCEDQGKGKNTARVYA